MVSLSVVTPSLNQGRFIERTIRSVLDQGLGGLDYIVCDGCSADNTPEVLEQFATQIRVVREPDTGQAEAVNKGILATSGEVIGWLNSDDVYLPGALRRVTAFMAARPDVDVLYGDAQYIDAQGAVLGTYYTEPWNPLRLVERCILCQPAVFFRRRVVEQHGLLDERLHLCLDYEYWLRLAAGGATFAYLPEQLAGYRLYPETKTMSARLGQHAEINSMLQRRFGRVPDSWLVNNAHTLVELDRARGGSVVPYALDVVLRAARLSLEWNGSISRELVAILAAPIGRGAMRRLARPS